MKRLAGHAAQSCLGIQLKIKGLQSSCGVSYTAVVVNNGCMITVIWQKAKHACDFTKTKSYPLKPGYWSRQVLSDSAWAALPE